METLKVTIPEEQKGQRLDKALSLLAPQFSRARLQSLIEAGQVELKGKPCADNSYKVKTDDVFTIIVPPAEEAEPRAQDIALDIVYEDKDLLVINKSSDMVVHPGAGNAEGTLVNALLAHCKGGLSGIGGVKRPGIVHRLDKETSGLMVVAKNDAAHHGLSEQLSSRTLKRIYHALVWGTLSPKSGRVETHIGRSKTNRKKMTVLNEGGKEAITDYKTLQNFGSIATLAECRLQTGRTHQIRVHMAHIKHWLVGDPVYGKTAIARFLKMHKTPEKLEKQLLSFERQALHAAQLEFIHPISKNKMTFKAEPPGDMQHLIAVLKRYRS